MEVGVASPSAYGWRRTLRGQTGFDRASSVLAPKKSQDQAPYRLLPDAFDQGGGGRGSSWQRQHRCRSKHPCGVSCRVSQGGIE